MTKRTFDILFAATGLIILLPVSLVISLLLYLDNRGPIFFSQKRIGLNLQPFTLYKFRSMTVDQSASKGSFDAGDQSRVTRFGKILRKSKLDELPQLFNVLKGDMSFVGPRPEVKKWVDSYPSRWAAIMTVKPGITDNAAILFRNEETLLAQAPDPELYYKEIILPKKLTIYSEYTTNHSVTGDIKIIFRTILSIIKT